MNQPESYQVVWRGYERAQGERQGEAFKPIPVEHLNASNPKIDNMPSFYPLATDRLAPATLK